MVFKKIFKRNKKPDSDLQTQAFKLLGLRTNLRSSVDTPTLVESFINAEVVLFHLFEALNIPGGSLDEKFRDPQITILIPAQDLEVLKNMLVKFRAARTNNYIPTEKDRAALLSILDKLYTKIINSKELYGKKNP